MLKKNINIDEEMFQQWFKYLKNEKKKRSSWTSVIRFYHLSKVQKIDKTLLSIVGTGLGISTL